MRAVFDGAAETVRTTDYQDACPIAVIALEVASTNERLRLATADVFESWIRPATARFAAAGFPKRRARELALALIAALEGAFVLARATRDTTALTVAGRTLADTVARELAALSPAPRLPAVVLAERLTAQLLSGPPAAGRRSRRAAAARRAGAGSARRAAGDPGANAAA